MYLCRYLNWGRAATSVEGPRIQLRVRRFRAVLDLHWTDGAYTGNSAACSSAEAICQKPMPDAAQAVPFWISVARAFGGNDAVIFDLFNEPYPEQADGGTETEGWRC